MLTTTAEIRATKTNPYHLSVGAVVTNQQRVALIIKPDYYVTLLRETIHLNESLAAALQRGAKEELGITIEIDRFLGGISRDSQDFGWTKPANTTQDQPVVEKTTVYFLCHETGKTAPNPEPDEVIDQVVWLAFDQAKELLAGCGNPEADILERACLKT